MLEYIQGRDTMTPHLVGLCVLGVIAAGLLASILFRSVMTSQGAKGDRDTDLFSASKPPSTGLGPRGSGESPQNTLRVADRERSYVLHLPSNLDRKKPSPLVFVFHGRLGTGRLMEKMTGFSDFANRGFIVVYPDGIGRSWNVGHGVGVAQTEGVDDVGFIARLIEVLSSEFNLDQRRIYAAGMSNGGMLAYRLACELRGRFAAVASVAGPLPPEIAHHCADAGPVSVLHIHGTDDTIVPWAGGETASRGKILSVDETVQQWVRTEKCAERPETTLVKGKVSCHSYLGCTQGVVVTLCRVEGGGHTWPGANPLGLLDAVVGPTNQDVNASELIWDFFSHHERATESGSADESPAQSGPEAVEPPQPPVQPTRADKEPGSVPE